MLTELYIEALLVDEDLADQVWYMWDAGIIPDEVAALVWWIVASGEEDMFDQGRASLGR